MCGIAGIVGINRDPDVVTQMTRALIHRGPNSGGFYRNRLASVGVRRLSIVDIDGGEQPILNEEETSAIVFNGEIYNYVELRALLQDRGHRFRSQSDSEVVLHLYEEYGTDCLNYLRGMYAFAIVSPQQVFIARDRLGIKPLYYAALAEDQLLFSSEIKALLQHPSLKVGINAAALADRRVLHHFTKEQTILEPIKVLPPGHYFLVKALSTSLDVQRHCFHTTKVDSAKDVTLSEAIQLFSRTFQKAVERHLQGDVPVGLTLSGGIDSSLIAHFLSSSAARLGSSFTISCSPNSADSVAARNLARELGLTHVELEPTYSEYVEMIPECVLAEESVPSLYALPFLLLCRRISADLKVCLNGEGSDELFGGYNEYSQQSSTTGRLLQALSAAERRGLPVSSRAREIVAMLASAKTFRDYLQNLLEIYQLEQLEYNHLLIVDRCSMAYGVEMRVPYIDDDVVGCVNRLPLWLKVNKELSISKYLLKHIALRQCGPVLYDPVLRSKAGMPSSGLNYLTRFTEWCDRSVSDDFARSHEYRAFFCDRGPDGGIRGKAGLLLFDLFCYFFVEHRGISPTSFSFREFLEDRMKAADVSALQLKSGLSAHEAYARG